ncbi:MAG: hypothetical protein U9O85_08910 [Euryarchaeota archaeon]|nr:hypothetical protein [Euryarchaeota archaeon]
MATDASRNIDIKLVIALILIALAIFAVVYYTSHREITDPSVLIAKTVDASKDVNSYRFALSTNLSTPEGAVEMMSGAGSVDYQNKKIRTTVTAMNRSIEMIVIGDTAYVRESYGSWQTQNVSGYSSSIWESDQLAQQRSLLANATNVTMQKEENGWVLDVIPDREEVLEQMRRTGHETIKEEELIDFSIEYRIEKDTYWITKIENKIELEMNIQGLVTLVKLNNSVKLYDYNKEMEIEAPI